MKTVAINKTFGADFGQQYIPQVYLAMLKDAVNNKKYMPLLSQVNEKFKVSKQDILNALKAENIIVSQVEDNYVLRFKNVLIKNNVRFEPLIDYMNDGELSFKGYNLFNDVTDYVNEHISTIRRYCLVKGE